MDFDKKHYDTEGKAARKPPAETPAGDFFLPLAPASGERGWG
jgi:hypothetical protein